MIWHNSRRWREPLERRGTGPRIPCPAVRSSKAEKRARAVTFCHIQGLFVWGKDRSTSTNHIVCQSSTGSPRLSMDVPGTSPHRGSPPVARSATLPAPRPRRWGRTRRLRRIPRSIVCIIIIMISIIIIGIIVICCLLLLLLL